MGNIESPFWINVYELEVIFQTIIRIFHHTYLSSFKLDKRIPLQLRKNFPIWVAKNNFNWGLRLYFLLSLLHFLSALKNLI